MTFLSDRQKRPWLIVGGLVLLSAVPVLAGAFRLTQLAGGADITPENARFFAAPVPVVLHIISVSVYAVLGALQFVPALRRGKAKWHRLAGRGLVLAGLVSALSGLWMTQFYPWPEGDGLILYGLRLVFGWTMVLSLGWGMLAIWQKNIAAHRAWMIRAYAIGMGAGTQVFTHLPWVLMFGHPGEFPRAILMGAGWVINVIIAEAIIRKRHFRRKPNRASKQANMPVS